MKGLMLKEFYMAWKYCRLHLVITVLFLGLAMLGDAENIMFLVYPSALASLIPVTLMSYDAQSKWDVYFETPPTSRAQYVSAKYLIGLILGEFLLLLVGLSQLLVMKLNGEGNLTGLLSLLCALQLLSFAPPALCMPFVFKWGVEKGRIWFLVMIGVVCGGSAGLAVGMGDGGSFSLPGNLPVWLVLGAAVLYALSWLLSIRLYRTREL